MASPRAVLEVRCLVKKKGVLPLIDRRRYTQERHTKKCKFRQKKGGSLKKKAKTKASRELILDVLGTIRGPLYHIDAHNTRARIYAHSAQRTLAQTQTQHAAKKPKKVCSCSTKSIDAPAQQLLQLKQTEDKKSGESTSFRFSMKEQRKQSFKTEDTLLYQMQILPE